MQTHRVWLDQCRVHRIDRVRDHERGRRRHDDELGEAAGTAAQTDELRRGAVHDVALRAPRARAAGRHRQDRHLRAHAPAFGVRADCHDEPTELVAHDRARRKGAQRLEVRPAHPAGGDAQEQLACVGHRIRHRGQIEGPALRNDCCLHDPVGPARTGASYL